MDAIETVPLDAGLIDLTGISLEELFGLEEDTALAHSVRRVTAPTVEQPNQSVSAFNSAV